MSVIPRPAPLGRNTPMSLDTDRGRAGTARDRAAELACFDVRFSVSEGAIRRSELASELADRGGAERRGSAVPISIRVRVRAGASVEDAGVPVPVIGEVVIELDGTALGVHAASFATVGTLRGRLAPGVRRLHLDLADEIGPWMRASVPVPETAEVSEVSRIGAFGGRKAKGSGRTDGASAGTYVWLRPLCDWRIAGGTASPRSIACIDASVPSRTGDGTHHAAAGS